MTGSISQEEIAGAGPDVEAEPAAPRTDRFARDWPLFAFAAVLVVALPLLMFWGRHGWFTQDDWDFLSARTIGNAGDLFRAHFQHWTTLPILAYRLLWVGFGIRTYAPYQAFVIVLHLTAAGRERTAGLAWWTGSESVYWGHNAVARPTSVGYVDFETVMNKAFADIRNGSNPVDRLSQATAELKRAFAKYQ